MSGISNKTELKTYEDSKPEKITVKSHWNTPDFVEIVIGKSRVIVSGYDLRKAIDNCMNVR